MIGDITRIHFNTINYMVDYSADTGGPAGQKKGKKGLSI
jgi:hypothetical protein